MTQPTHDGQTVKELREHLGLSRREVSEMTGLTPSQIWTIEHSPSMAERGTANFRHVIEKMQEWELANPQGKDRKPTRPRSTTTTLRHALKLALTGIAGLAAIESIEPAVRDALLGLHDRVTTAALAAPEGGDQE